MIEGRVNNQHSLALAIQVSLEGPSCGTVCVRASNPGQQEG